jgi:Na+-driven multidrug efflux pump
MAMPVTIEGGTYLRRDALGVAVLSIVTFGIYFFYWYYKVNDEARRYLGDDSINPVVALLAVLLGWIIIVPPFVSGYRTAERILRMQQRAGANPAMSPPIALILQLFVGFVYPWYLQDGLNAAWDASQGTAEGAPPAASLLPGSAPLPPPPP